MSEQRFRKVNDKLYQVELNGKYEDINVPYGKIEKLLASFFGEGGMLDAETGQVMTDLPSLIRNFREIGDILLSEYNAKGEVVVEKYCGDLAAADIVSLFLLAQELIQNFTSAISEMTGAGVAEGKTKKKKVD